MSCHKVLSEHKKKKKKKNEISNTRKKRESEAFLLDERKPQPRTYILVSFFKEVDEDGAAL